MSDGFGSALGISLVPLFARRVDTVLEMVGRSAERAAVRVLAIDFANNSLPQSNSMGDDRIQHHCHSYSYRCCTLAINVRRSAGAMGQTRLICGQIIGSWPK